MSYQKTCPGCAIRLPQAPDKLMAFVAWLDETNQPTPVAALKLGGRIEPCIDHSDEEAP